MGSRATKGKRQWGRGWEESTGKGRLRPCQERKQTRKRNVGDDYTRNMSELQRVLPRESLGWDWRGGHNLDRKFDRKSTENLSFHFQILTKFYASAVIIFPFFLPMVCI